MTRLRLSAGIGMFFFLSLLIPGSVSAKHGRDFAGFYDVSDALDLGEQVQVTVTLRVFNYSDAAVADATVTLEDPLLPGEIYGSFSVLYLPDRESVPLSGAFTLPRREYEYWQQGGSPSLRISFTDLDGNAVRGTIELVQMLLGEE